MSAQSPKADTELDPASVLSKLRSANGQLLTRSPSGSQPVCLICLENLTPEDFEVCCMHVLPHRQHICFSVCFYFVCLLSVCEAM